VLCGPLGKQGDIDACVWLRCVHMYLIVSVWCASSMSTCLAGLGEGRVRLMVAHGALGHLTLVDWMPLYFLETFF
jgi:hypothetical protein